MSKIRSPIHCVPLWFTNFHAQAVAPVMSARAPDIFPLGLREHLFSDRNPHIDRHLKDSVSCRDFCSEACFSILDSAPTVFQLKIKEALRIEWERHSLNQQLKYFNLTLVVNVSLIITINLYFSIFFFRLV